MKTALIGCECSGVVRDAFRAIGIDAWSCDLKPCEKGSEFHIEGDVVEAIGSREWDFIGLHPDCTKLAVSGNRWYGFGTPGYNARCGSIIWTRSLWKLATSQCDHVYLENPVGVLSNVEEMPKPFYIQPWQFGHGETKKTGLWLHGLPKLIPTNVVQGREQRVWRMGPGENRKTERSRTYQGIADAMAEQWGTQL